MMKNLKRLCLVLMVLLGIMSTGIVGIAVAEENPKLVFGVNGYERLETIVSSFADRTSGTQAAENVATFLVEEFSGMGYLPYAKEGKVDNFGRQYFDYLNPHNSNKSEKACNVIYKKDNAGTSKNVVIGASYDNVAALKVDGKEVGGEGAYGNGTGLAAMLEVAKYFGDKTLPYDVTFVAFGAETVGIEGSRYFVSQLSQVEKNDLLLMINLNCVAGGDSVYMYSEEVKTLHNENFYKVASDNNLSFKAVPSNKRQTSIVADRVSGLPMIHRGIMSDNSPFLKERINTVNYLSVNWEDKSKPSVVETAGKENIYNSSFDTLAKLVERTGKDKLSLQLNSVISSVIYSLEQENFIAVMEESFSKKANMSWLSGNTISYIAWAVKFLIIILAIVFSNILAKNYRKENPYIPSVAGYQPPSPKVINPFDELEGGNDNSDDNNPFHI